MHHTDPADPAPARPGTAGGPAPSLAGPSRDGERTLALLESIERRLARLEARLEPATNALAAAPGLLATVTDSVDERIAEPAELDRRLRALLPLLERVSRPETLRSLSGLVDALESAPGMFATLGDTVDDVAGALAEHGIRLDRVGDGVGAGVVRLAQILADDSFRQILDSGITDPRVLRLLGGHARAFASAAEEPPSRLGPWGLLAALRREEVQRAMGYLVQIASQVGATLSNEGAPPAAQPKTLQE